MAKPVILTKDSGQMEVEWETREVAGSVGVCARLQPADRNGCSPTGAADKTQTDRQTPLCVL